MTNEEKILERLDELTTELREAKQAIRPYVELKQEMEPLLKDMVISAMVNSVAWTAGLISRISGRW
jgi:hypothetical protein